MVVIERDIHRLAGREFDVGFRQAARRSAVRRDESGWRAADEDRRLGDGCVGAADACRPGKRAACAHPRLATVAEAEVDLCRCVGGRDRSGTGRVHTSYAQCVASTGRLSSNDPNCRTFRSAPTKAAASATRSSSSRVICSVSADYSQIELRLLAHVAAIPALQESFARGEDIHARTASEVFGIPMAGMDPMTRRRAKAINFGIIYGISSFGLGRQLGITPGEARTYIDAYFTRYPSYPHVYKTYKEEARINGYVTTPFGRRCWVPGISKQHPRVAVTPSARRSMHHCRAAVPTSSSAQWCGCRRRYGRRDCARDCCCRCMTNCCSRRQTTKCRR